MEQRPERFALIAKNWRDLIRPRELDVVEHTAHHARFRCEPLERGFGTTLGVMLRRTMLSALPGAAITHVAIASPSVDPDVLVCRLKEVVFASEHAETITARLAKRGPGVVTAADIALTEGITCVNPAHAICTLAADEEVVIELAIAVGRGYVPADRHAARRPDMQAIDALFAPVRRVDFSVTNARVGHQTDYDRLAVDVWTNGALDPVDAVARAASILRHQLDLFLNFEEVPEPPPVARDVRAEKQSENLWRTVEELELSVRATNCLRNLNITYIGELVTKTESQLMKTRGFGRKSLTEIAAVLAALDLQLGMRLEAWPGPRAASEERG
jgi:DNA-directed RNA polymerase subunit alpha